MGIRDERTGRILTARRRPELLAAAAAYDDDLPVITLPDGRTAVGPGLGTDSVLSQWLGSPVSLVSSASGAGGRAEYFADATDDSSQAIEWTMPAGRYVDAAPVLALTTASLRTAAELHPFGTWDPRRFRPNMLIDVEGEGWVEDQWVSHSLQIGAATLMPTQPCIRCTMVTRASPDSKPMSTFSALRPGTTAATSASGPTYSAPPPCRSGNGRCSELVGQRRAGSTAIANSSARVDLVVFLNITRLPLDPSRRAPRRAVVHHVRGHISPYSQPPQPGQESCLWPGRPPVAQVVATAERQRRSTEGSAEALRAHILEQVCRRGSATTGAAPTGPPCVSAPHLDERSR